MKSFGDLYQSGDWQGEKHVPIIHCPDQVKAHEDFEIKVSIGDAIGHPNTLEHYISWFKIFFLPNGKKFPIELTTFTFHAHGEGDIYTKPQGQTTVQLPSSGTLYATSWCNIHGIWESSKEIIVE